MQSAIELPTMKPGVNVEISQGIATITFNRPKSFNAITAEGMYPGTWWWSSRVNHRHPDYDAFGEALYSIDKRDDVTVTVWQGPYMLHRYLCGIRC